jgi:hypothetical protein
MVTLPIVKRLERCQTSPSVIELKTQWMLSVTAEGSLTFDAFPDGAFASGEESDDSPRSPKSPESRPSTRISTAAGTIPFGEWRHVALVVDASAAAKESAIRLKSAAVTAGTNSTSSLSSPPPPPPLPSARVRLFIDGEAADDAEGDIGCLMPLPVIDDRLDTHDGSAATSPSAALTTDFLVLAPGFVGRLGEVRLWSKKKSSDEISEAKDFHLDMAESKRGKMTIQIRAAAAPVPSSATASVLPPSASLSANTNGAEGSIVQTTLTLSAETSSSSTASVTSSVASSSSALPLPPTIKKLGAPLGGLGGGLAAPPSGVSSKRKVLAATSTTASVPTSTAPPLLGKTSSTFDDDFASGFSSSTLSSSSSSLSSESTSIEQQQQQQQQHSSSTPSVSSSISNDSDFDSTPVPTIKKPFGGLSKPGGGLSAPPPPAASSKKKAMMAKSKTVEGGT